MPDSPTPEDVHTRIQNAIAMLAAEAPTAGPAAQHGFRLAVETLRAAEEAVTELEAELDLVTAPELRAAEEAQKLRHELEEAEVRYAALSQKLALLQEERTTEDAVHAEGHRRLQKLEKETAEIERLLETDAGAFGKFMDRALDQDEKQGRLKKRDNPS